MVGGLRGKVGGIGRGGHSSEDPDDGGVHDGEVVCNGDGGDHDGKSGVGIGGGGGTGLGRRSVEPSSDARSVQGRRS